MEMKRITKILKGLHFSSFEMRVSYVRLSNENGGEVEVVKFKTLIRGSIEVRVCFFQLWG